MKYPPEQEGRCKTCGFLAQRTEFDSFSREGTFHEVRADQRTKWMPSFRPSPGLVIRAKPVCFVGAADLDAEFGSRGPDDSRLAESAKVVFDKDRKCPKWYPYTPEFSPKEHLERHQTERAEHERRQFEERLEENRRQFELRMQADNKRFQNQDDNLSCNHRATCGSMANLVRYHPTTL